MEVFFSSHPAPQDRLKALPSRATRPVCAPEDGAAARDASQIIGSCPIAWPPKPVPISCSTKTTRLTGIHGVTRHAAREEDKPIFLSIGYSTCHWCHVMEHESFEGRTSRSC